MTEEVVRVELPDGKALYGRYVEHGDAPVVVLVHGLTGSLQGHLHVNAARRFSDAGYSTLRVNLYGNEPDARRLLDCTPSRHASDIDVVVRCLRAQSPSRAIVLVGHSLGGLSSLLVRESFDGLVMWDATHTSDLSTLDSLQWVEELGVYRWPRRVETLIGKPLMDELRSLNSDELIARVKVPLLVASADSARRIEVSQRYCNRAALNLARCITIPSADHTFSFGDTAESLYTETLKWLPQALGR